MPNIFCECKTTLHALFIHDNSADYLRVREPCMENTYISCHMEIPCRMELLKLKSKTNIVKKLNKTSCYDVYLACLPVQLVLFHLSVPVKKGDLPLLSHLVHHPAQTNLIEYLKKTFVITKANFSDSCSKNQMIMKLMNNYINTPVFIQILKKKVSRNLYRNFLFPQVNHQFQVFPVFLVFLSLLE